MATTSIPGFYTMREAAEVIGCDVSQITRYIRNKQIPGDAVKDLGHQKLIEQYAVHQFTRRPRGNPNFQKKDKPQDVA